MEALNDLTGTPVAMMLVEAGSNDCTEPPTVVVVRLIVMSFIGADATLTEMLLRAALPTYNESTAIPTVISLQHFVLTRYLVLTTSEMCIWTPRLLTVAQYTS